MQMNRTQKIVKFLIKFENLQIIAKNSIPKKTNQKIRQLRGNFIKLFEKKLSLLEKMNIKLQKYYYVFNLSPRRTNSSILPIIAYCKLCKFRTTKENWVKYYIWIPKKPKNNIDNVTIYAKIVGIHHHSNHNYVDNKESLLSLVDALDNLFNLNN